MKKKFVLFALMGCAFMITLLSTHLDDILHAETSDKECPVEFYKKGYNIEYVDSNTIKIAPGIMDVAGKMLATTDYSNPLKIGAWTVNDWINGAKTNNSYVYIYAYDNLGTINFKVSSDAPNLSDHLGNTVKKPFVYRKFTINNKIIYFRCIGRVYIDNAGNIATADSLTDEVPAGAIMIWPTNTIPSGWLLCDGNAVSRVEYAGLFSVIGITYGAGDGSTTFNLPNLKGRVPVGCDSAQQEFYPVTKTGGEKAHKLTTGEAPSLYLSSRNPGFSPPEQYATSYNDDAKEHNNLQPYIILHYIIKI